MLRQGAQHLNLDGAAYHPESQYEHELVKDP
jgi:hypothetical protein